MNRCLYLTSDIDEQLVKRLRKEFKESLESLIGSTVSEEEATDVAEKIREITHNLLDAASKEGLRVDTIDYIEKVSE